MKINIHGVVNISFLMFLLNPLPVVELNAKFFFPAVYLYPLGWLQAPHRTLLMTVTFATSSSLLTSITTTLPGVHFDKWFYRVAQPRILDIILESSFLTLTSNSVTSANLSQVNVMLFSIFTATALGQATTIFPLVYSPGLLTRLLASTLKVYFNVTAIHWTCLDLGFRKISQDLK